MWAYLCCMFWFFKWSWRSVTIYLNFSHLYIPWASHPAEATKAPVCCLIQVYLILFPIVFFVFQCMVSSPLFFSYSCWSCRVFFCNAGRPPISHLKPNDRLVYKVPCLVQFSSFLFSVKSFAPDPIARSCYSSFLNAGEGFWEEVEIAEAKCRREAFPSGGGTIHTTDLFVGTWWRGRGPCPWAWEGFHLVHLGRLA